MLAGVILFTRNYQSAEQLRRLTASIKSINPDLFISVDHEGGRVQRFREEFSALPDQSLINHADQAYERGRLMGKELSEAGIDINFAPVVDLLHPGSELLKGRCFEQASIAECAMRLIDGMDEFGVEGVIKHYPGHGGVVGDTHTDAIVDSRSFRALWEKDMMPFKECIEAGVKSIMASWVIYPECDKNPACFSSFWLKTILREKLGFKGKIFSDDMGMEAAKVDAPIACVQKAREAGCDYILLCNEFEVIDYICSSATA